MAAEFLVTVGDAIQLPDLLNGQFLKGAREPRIAMVGRSNVGKSSLINALLGTRLAQVSKEPGKTRKIHFYRWLDGKKILADLPGYGYAKAAHSERDRWKAFIEAYLTSDENLEQVFILLDARHGPTELDVDAIKFIGGMDIPLRFIFTKYDALKTQSDRAKRAKEATAALKKLGYDSPNSTYWVSITSMHGIESLVRGLAKQEK